MSFPICPYCKGTRIRINGDEHQCSDCGEKWPREITVDDMLDIPWDEAPEQLESRVFRTDTQ